MRNKTILAFMPGVSFFILSLFILLVPVVAAAQTVSGTVSDESGKKLNAVSVTVKGTSQWQNQYPGYLNR